MCGIVGVMGMQQRDEAAATVARMSKLIQHRGPDGHGSWVGDRVAIGMRRLSIIDVEGGQQPMMTDDGVVIVFNGEIYNHDALRSRLSAQGARFRTRSDTEVILQLYRHGGLEALNDLEGMYAICLVDRRSDEVHLIRDRMGIKPLYYGEVGEHFYFGSELKSIIGALPKKPAVRAQSIYDYLSLRFVPAPNTIWEGIQKLPPGHRLTYDLKYQRFWIRRYWKLEFEAADDDASRNVEREFEERFLHAVDSHFHNSDVPVGTLLSGGLDSSAVLAALTELGNKNTYTFSVAFDEGYPYNELEYARQMAQAMKTNHHEVVIGAKEFLEFLPEFCWYVDEPLADLASIPLHFVSQLASRHVKVVMSGEGSDEILAGYNFETVAQQADGYRRRFGWIPRQTYAAAAPLFRGSRREVLAAMGREGWSGYLKGRNTFVTDLPAGIKAEFWRGGAMRPTDDVVGSWYDGCASQEPLDKLQYVWCQDWLVEDLLMKADKMTMRNSLELRVPFLTHSFVDWARTLPLRYRVGNSQHGYESKAILRRFAARRIPDSIIKRPKLGFPVPAYRWLQGALSSWATDRVNTMHEQLREWINPEAVARRLALARNGDTEAAAQVWKVLVLDEWFRCWL